MANVSTSASVWRWCLLVAELCSLLLATPQGTRLQLVNGGYENLLVAIQRGVPQNNEILDELQVLLTSASGHLYNATGQRVHFRSVTLLVPEAWQPQPGWEQITWELPEEADVRVAPPSPLYNNTPYVFQPGGCGDPGRFLHLTPHFLVGDRLARDAQFGDVGKLLVHEFAHYRWGVFDEYGIVGDPLHPPFYRDDENNIRPTGCVRGIRGIFEDRVTRGQCRVNVTTGLPDQNCLFLAELSDVNDARASLMYLHFLPTIDSFCEGGVDEEVRRHDPWAPNMQNRMCRGRGTWDVISEHPDFRNGNSPPGMCQNTTPIFRIVQARPGGPERGCHSRIVLVLDTSMSMLTNSRYFRQKQVIGQFIRLLPTGVQLAIVTFNRKAKVVVALTRITGEHMRRGVTLRLPAKTDHRFGTAIGQGIQRAFTLLNSKGCVSRRDHVLLLTDGKETRSPHIREVLQQLLPSPIRIHTVAYSSQASPSLRTLSQRTGGLYFYYSEGSRAADLNSALARLASALSACNQGRTTQLASRVERLRGGGARKEGEVYVDSGAGNHLLFSFSAPEELAFNVRLTSPSGQDFSRDSQQGSYDSNLNTLEFRIDQPEVGLWRYTVTSERDAGSVTLTLLGRANATEKLLDVESWLSSLEADLSKGDYPTIYAYVHQGELPVVMANVTALVRGPKNDVISLPLRDDGVRPDTRRNDGVYTALFLQFSGNTRYAVDVRVDVQDRTAYLVTLGSMPGAPSRPEYPGAIQVPSYRLEPAGRFQRTSSVGAFDVQGYVPSRDLFPPAEVADLRVTAISRDEMAVTLEWTAVGDDLTQGTASRYELRIADSFEAIHNNFSAATLVTLDMILDGDLDPLPSGSLQRVKVNVTAMAKQRAFVFGVMAMDKVNQMSQVVAPAAASLLPPQYPQNTGQAPQLPLTSAGRNPWQSCFPSCLSVLFVVFNLAWCD